VPDERMNAALALLGAAPERAAAQRRAAALAAAALGVDGICAGVGTGLQGAVMAWGCESVAVAVEGLEFTLGEGPSRDAVIGGAPVLVPDLDAPDQAARWPAFAYGVAGFPVRAVFAFPLRIGAVSVGVMTAHRAVPGSLTDGQLTTALTLADAVALLLVHRVDVDPDPVHGQARGFRPGWERPATYRADVHQATGMISVQLEVSLAEALVRLRAHAYAEDRPVAEIAADVLARCLRFTDVN
jgi:hypothetical protein